MSDDLGKKIQQIAELLGQDSVPDNVKELVELLATSMAKKEDSSGKNVPPAENTVSDANVTAEVSAESGSPERQTEKNALSRMNTSNDPRINLLHAIKPFMNSKRQKKIGNCIQLLQVAGLSRMLNDRDSNPR